MRRFLFLIILILAIGVTQAAQLRMNFDALPPDVSLLFPKEGMFEINADTSIVDFSFSLKNYSAITNCTLLVKNADRFAPVAVKYDFDASGSNIIPYDLGIDEYKWKVLCYDVAGHSAESEERSLEVFKQIRSISNVGSFFLVISIVILILLIIYVLFTSEGYKVYRNEKRQTDSHERLRKKLEELRLRAERESLG